MKLLIFAFIICLTSCINVSKYLGTEYKTNSLQIEGSVSSIEFADKREGVTKDIKFKLPTISNPNQIIENLPILDSIDKKNISSIIYKNFQPNNKNTFKLMIDLLEGKKNFFSQGLQETEQVKVKIRITTIAQSGELSFEESKTYSITSMDAKNKRLNDLYRGALQAVTFEVLKDIKKSQLKK